MNEQMKGITCCGDCAHYDWEKHRCPRAKDRGSAQSSFYADCPLPDVRPVVRGKWIRKFYPEHGDGIVERRFYCSACGRWNTYGRPDFCMNCGADMRFEVTT